MTPPEDPPERGCLRRDAERNRDKILCAARALYADDGIATSMSAVARSAGVGIATLFRRFPTRDHLVAAVFEDRMDAYVAAVRAALSDPDPWRGFTGFVQAVCAMQATDRGFADVLTLTFPKAKALEAKRREAYEGFTELIERAKAAGRLRDDFVPEDLPILLMANAGVVTATGDAAPDAWRRLVGHMLRAFAAPASASATTALPADEPLPSAPTPTALHRAMIRLHRRA